MYIMGLGLVFAVVSFQGQLSLIPRLHSTAFIVQCRKAIKAQEWSLGMGLG